MLEKAVALSYEGASSDHQKQRYVHAVCSQISVSLLSAQFNGLGWAGAAHSGRRIDGDAGIALN